MRGHVVGHDIGDQAHAVFARGLRERDQRIFAAEFGIDHGRVDVVVAVRGARHRRTDRRQIQVTDAQPGVIRQLREGIVQGETGMQLQAGGGA